MFVNLCPHDLCLVFPTGELTVPASGVVARVGTVAVVTRFVAGFEVRVVSPTAVQGLPAPDGVSVFLVSGFVVEALKRAGVKRADVLAPATGPQDGAVRNAAGQVVGVTRFDGLV